MDEKKPRTWKYYVGYTLALCAAAMTVWPLMGLLISIFNDAPFVYDPKDYLFRPLLFGVLLGAYNFHVDVNRK